MHNKSSADQCFSSFSLKWNPLQKFWFLLKPLGMARNLFRGRHSWGPKPKFEVEGRDRGRAKEPQLQMHFGRTKKTHLVAANDVSSSFSIWFNGTLGYHWRKTAVEKHCCRKTVIDHLRCSAVKSHLHAKQHHVTQSLCCIDTDPYGRFSCCIFELLFRSVWEHTSVNFGQQFSKNRTKSNWPQNSKTKNSDSAIWFKKRLRRFGDGFTRLVHTSADS